MKQKIKIAVEFEAEVDTSDKYFPENLAQIIERSVTEAHNDIKPTHDFCFLLDSDKDYRLGNFDDGLY